MQSSSKFEPLRATFDHQEASGLFAASINAPQPAWPLARRPPMSF